MKDKKFDVITFGRSSIDLYSQDVGTTFNDISGFDAFVGGSPLNIAVALARLGSNATLLTAVGNDKVGEFIVNFLNKENVNTHCIPVKNTARSSAVVLGIEPPNKFPLVYYRDNAADSQVTIDDVQNSNVQDYKILLINGTALNIEPSRSSTFYATEVAVKNNVDVVLDLDFRVVFGTKFNFKNYEEDNFSEIILTEGSLGVKNTIDKTEVVIIKPGDMARVDYSLGKIELSKVNTVLYTSWVDGRIIFRNENINNMITKLERIYDVIIINNSIELNKMFINATFLTEKETIQDVLDYMVKIYNVDYQIMNNKIIIN